jgi:peptide/nickel transport system ATP-binding protein
MVFQNPYSSLNPRRKVGSQLGDALDALDLTPRRGRRARIEELLDLVGLPSAAAAGFPHQFSGGQRQRIAVARALAADPSVLVLDEPLASLDASAQAQLANLLVDLSRRLSLSLLLISHDLAIVRHVADVVSVMYLGVIVESGPTQPLWSLPLHPYTEALIGAVPSPDGRGVLPDALPGEVPDPARPPAACRFHPRCPYAFDRCSQEDPVLLELAPARSAACWLQAGTERPAPPAERARRLSLLSAEG